MPRVTWNVPEEYSKRPREKNLLYCPGANRSKLHFDSWEAAKKHIDMNGPEILRESGKAPIRVYWCPDCCCYHVTSKPGISERMTENKKLKLAALELIRESLLAKVLLEGQRNLVKAYDIIRECTDCDWYQEVKDKAYLALEILEKKAREQEFNRHVKEAEYRIRISDLSGAELEISWLEQNNLNPDKTKKLRDVLLGKIL
jgi:hypothetical protein